MKLHSRHENAGCRIEHIHDGAATRIALTGRLDAAGASDAVEALHYILGAHDKRNEFLLDLERLDSIDDYGAAIIARLKKMLFSQGRSLVIVKANEGVRRVLDFHRVDAENPSLARDRGARLSSNLLVRLGGATIEHVEDATFMTTFLGGTILSMLRLLKGGRRLRWGDVLHYMGRTGVDALPIVGLISFLLGLIMAFMSSVQLRQFGANIYVASLVSLAMTRELGPIMTAIIVAGRSGSSYAAEIGSMKISEEIDALATMGIDPHIFLVMPKIIAALLVIPLLTLFSDLFAILGGLVVGVGMLDLTVNGYVNQTLNTLSLFDVFWGVFKSAVFALLISWTGCLRGFQASGGAAGVGRVTTSAVVSSIFLIILADSIFAVILTYWE